MEERRMGSKRVSIAAGSLMAIVVLGAFAWTATHQELASGSGRDGDWRVVTSWRGEHCIQRFEDHGHGGACGLAEPGTLNESISWAVSRGDEQRTLVAGAVPPDTEQVTVTPADGEVVDASLSQVFMMTFFVAEVPGIQAIDDIRALDGNGDLIQVHEHAPLPPPEDVPASGLGEPPPASG